MKRFAPLCCIALVWTTVIASAQRPDPSSPRFKAATALQAFLEDDLAPAETFVREHFGKEHAGDDAFSATVASLEEVRGAVNGFRLDGLSPEGEYQVAMQFASDDGRSIIVRFALQDAPPHHFITVAVEAAEAGDSAPPLRWDTVEQHLDDEAAKNGFCGAVLLVRDNQIFLHKAYGLANREKNLANSTETIFAVGSTPIDFTKASILLLVDRGEVSLDDPIGKYFDNVPADKVPITVRHLMTGQSGLRDFHDLPGDENPDHTWIDRDEAVRRIFDQKLLFEPGTGSEHSHSAWGLLAAIVEIASGRSYQEFTRENIYKPLGMNDTGFFGEPFPEERVAVGYGLRKSSEPNSPPHWGPTSWLVMGSGGQVSTLKDMFRFVAAMRSGELLSEKLTQEHYDRRGVYSNGDMFGFEFFYSDGPDSMVFLISNAVNSREQTNKFNRLGRDLLALVRQQAFSLGVSLGIGPEGVTIQHVHPGSAAQRDGLNAGDRIISIGGQQVGDDPVALLEPSLKTGAVIQLGIEREGERLEIQVTPIRR